MIKKSLKIFLGILIFVVLLTFYLLSDFNPIYQNDEFVTLTNKLKDTKKENLNAFILIYEKINSKTREKKCQCDRATDYIGPYRHGYSPTKLLYKLKIQRKFTQTDCFKYILLNTNFKSTYSTCNYKTFGVKEASKFYFTKNVEQLNRIEVITLFAMLQNPSLYDPRRNKEGLYMRVKVLESILKSSILKPRTIEPYSLKN